MAILGPYLLSFALIIIMGFTLVFGLAFAWIAVVVMSNNEPWPKRLMTSVGLTVLSAFLLITCGSAWFAIVHINQVYLQ